MNKNTTDNLAAGRLAPSGDWLESCFTGLSNMHCCCAFRIASAALFLHQWSYEQVDMSMMLL